MKKLYTINLSIIILGGLSFAQTMIISGILALAWIAFPMTANAAELHVGSGQTYSTISNAITAASDGDVIIVHDGTYTENVVVNKQLTIQSVNGPNTTTVVAASTTDHVFEVPVGNVTINGFSIYGATGGGRVGIYLTSVTNCTIENNRCGWDGTHTNYYGIYMNASSNCAINNNTASYNTEQGIYLASSSENTLTSNVASNNSVDGIFLSFSSSNTLGSNTASNNTWDGIHIESSSNNTTLNNNTTNDNGTSGIVLNTSSNNDLTNNTAISNGDNIPTPGISLNSSSNNTLNNNTANYNKTGIQLEVSSSSNNLTSNTVNHNEFGIYLTESSNNTITSNTMNDNDGRWDGDGIMLNNNCSNNTIANNTMNNDPGDGIEFYNSSNNTVMGNTLDNSGAAMRINCYSSYNTIINNTVINSEKGIVLEEESNYNFVSNNTITGHSSRGFEFYENASYNTLTGNNISNNGTYGIWLYSGSYNTIYLNDISNNTTSNIYSGNASTTWHSPTTIYYDYNSGTFHKGYLGNYYSDGTHTGSYGIGGTYTIATDNDDEYQLMQTSGNYSLQAWWLYSDDKMYRDDFTKAGGSVTISGSSSNIWIADQAALTDINFSGSDTWTGQLVFTSAPTGGVSPHTFTVEIGSSTNGSDFTAGGPDATITGDGSATVFTFTTDASAFSVTTGKYLALKITSNDAEYSIRTGGAWSYTSSPDQSMDYLVNDPPVIISADSVGATEDFYFKYTATAIDPDGPTLIWVFDQLPGWLSSDTDSVFGIPHEGSVDTSFRVIASDGSLSDTMIVAVTVIPVNDAPVITSADSIGAIEDVYFKYTATATDPDGPMLIWAFDQLPRWLSSDADSVFGIPHEGSVDTSFRVIASDGSLSDTMIVAVTVIPVNNPPEFISALPDTAFDEDNALELPLSHWFGYVEDVDNADSTLEWDIEGNDSVFTLISANKVVFSSPLNWYGKDSLKVIITDGELSDTTILIATVNPVNDAPVITSVDSVTATEDIYFKYLAIASDVEDSSITFSFDDLPCWLSSDADSVDGIPSEGMKDTSFVVIASDGELNDTLTVLLTVIDVNDPPVISTIPDTSFNEDEQLKFANSYFYIFVYDPDNADSFLTWSFSDTDNVYVTMDKDSIILSSQIDWFGKDTLSVKVSDGEFFDEVSFVVSVHPVNDSPYFTELMPDSILFDSNVRDTLLLTELASDVDNPDSSLNWSYIHSSFVLCHINDTMKTAIFWVEENLSGQDTVVLSVSDGEFTVYDSLIVIVNPVTGIEYLMSQIPKEYSLKQNYPNPFNPTTTIIYGLPKLGHVDIRIYDLLGREIKTLVNDNQEAKHYKVIWDAKDRSGNNVPSGMYLYRILAKSGDKTFVKTRKLLLMR